MKFDQIHIFTLNVYFPLFCFIRDVEFSITHQTRSQRLGEVNVITHSE